MWHLRDHIHWGVKSNRLAWHLMMLTRQGTNHQQLVQSCSQKVSKALLGSLRYLYESLSGIYYDSHLLPRVLMSQWATYEGILRTWSVLCKYQQVLWTHLTLGIALKINYGKLSQEPYCSFRHLHSSHQVNLHCIQ